MRKKRGTIVERRVSTNRSSPSVICGLFFFSADGSSIKLPRERREYIEANDGEKGDREEVVG